MQGSVLATLPIYLAFAFVAFLTGALAAWLDIPPFAPHLRNAFIGTLALLRAQTDNEDLLNSDVWLDASGADLPMGVTTYAPEAMQPGYTLITVGQGAYLVDGAGRTVHRWHLPYRDLKQEAPGALLDQEVHDTFLYWKPARLLPNGDLIAIVDRMRATPEGLALIKIDRQSRPIWIRHHHVHHDFDVAPDGRIFALDQRIAHEVPSGLAELTPPVLDEGVVVFSTEGKELARISIIEAFSGTAFESQITRLVKVNRERWGDYLHSNNVDYVTAELAAAFDFLEEGQVILSFREIDTIAALDLKSRKITWASRGQWMMQHDPDLLPNGNILLFDNRGDWARGGTSRVLEIDPETHEVVWRFPAAPGQSLDSPERGDQQKLANGNVLINEFYNRRVLEVAPTGEIVWSFHCPFRKEGQPELVCRSMSAIRYLPEEIQFAARSWPPVAPGGLSSNRLDEGLE